MKCFVLIFKLLLLILLPQVYGAQSIKNISLTTQGSKHIFTIEFNQDVPKFTSTLKPMDGVQALVLDFPQTTLEKSEVFHTPSPPVFHLEAFTPSEDSLSTRVVLYTESSAEGLQKQSKNLFIIEFNSTDKIQESSPSQLESFSFRENDENNFSLRLDFDETPLEPLSFLSLNKKSAIIFLPNTGVTHDAVKDIVSPLIKFSKVDGGITPAGAPYLKIILSSEQELLADLAKDAKTIFYDIYGMQNTQSPILEADSASVEDDEIVIKINRSPSAEDMNSTVSWAHWVYPTVGAIALVGAGIAGYLFWVNQSDSRADEIKDPSCTLFPNSSCDSPPQ